MLLAASFVNVTIAISSAILATAPNFLLQRYAILETIENVFPVPAPASTNVITVCRRVLYFKLLLIERSKLR